MEVNQLFDKLMVDLNRQINKLAIVRRDSSSKLLLNKDSRGYLNKYEAYVS